MNYDEFSFVKMRSIQGNIYIWPKIVEVFSNIIFIIILLVAELHHALLLQILIHQVLALEVTLQGGVKSLSHILCFFSNNLCIGRCKPCYQRKLVCKLLDTLKQSLLHTEFTFRYNSYI